MSRPDGDREGSEGPGPGFDRTRSNLPDDDAPQGEVERARRFRGEAAPKQRGAIDEADSVGREQTIPREETTA